LTVQGLLHERLRGARADRIVSNRRSKPKRLFWPVAIYGVVPR